MSFSINTNLGAMVALQSLQATTSSLTVSQSRISTGMRVMDSLDNAGFAIAMGIRSTAAGLAGANTGMDTAKDEIGSAMTAGQNVTDTVSAMRTLALQASGQLSPAQRSIVQNQMNSLRDQLDSAAGSSRLTSGTDQDLTVVSSSASSFTVRSADLTSQGLGLAAQVGTTTTASGAASTLAVQVQTGQQALTGSDPLDLSDPTAAARAVTTLDQALTTASTATASLGSSSRRIDAQTEFNTVMSNALATSGQNVDADLATESSRLQSLQVRQQLGIQALSIANQVPQALLSLFG